MEQGEVAVVHHLCYMRMTGDEEAWRGCAQLARHGAVVTAGVAADVFHQHVDVFAAETELQGELAAHVRAVNVAVHAAQGSYGAEAVGNGERAEVAGVPYLVAVGEVVGETGVPVGMGVGE